MVVLSPELQVQREGMDQGSLGVDEELPAQLEPGNGAMVENEIHIISTGVAWFLRNHAGSCGFPEPEWIQHALDHPDESRRKHHAARMAVSYLDSEVRPYVFLLDGGVADNIGARRIIADVTLAGGTREQSGSDDSEVPEYMIFILVNAQAGGRHEWDTKQSLPSLGSVMNSISGAGIYRYNFETIELLRQRADEWETYTAKRGLSLETFVVEVAFENLSDASERKFFNEVSTTWNLDDETVDRLIEVGGRLLRDSPDFKQFMETVR